MPGRPQRGPRSRSQRTFDAATSKVLARAARLNKAIPGAGDRLLVDAATNLAGFLDRHAQTFAGPVSAARIRAQRDPR